MRKIFLTTFLFFLLFGTTFAYTKPQIITREQWGANDEYFYSDSAIWKAKYKKWAAKKKWKAEHPTPKKEPTAYQKKLRQRKAQARRIWVNTFPQKYKTVRTIKELNGRPLAWDIKFTENIGGIVIHHTETSAETSLATIRSIQKFHSVSREWGDIGYTYLIGMDGRIYEGRA